jgi:hypothetical protein
MQAGNVRDATYVKKGDLLCSFLEAELGREFPVHYEAIPDATLSSCTVFHTLAIPWLIQTSFSSFTYRLL